MKNFVMRDCKEFTEENVKLEYARRVAVYSFELVLFAYVFIILWCALPK